MRSKSIPRALRAALLVILPALLMVATGSHGAARAEGTEIEHPENDTGSVASFSVTDEEGTVVGWSLTGVDGGDFSIEGGTVTFRQSPDFEAPADSDLDNDYQVTVNVTDGTNTASVVLRVTVANVDETGAVFLSSIHPEVGVPMTATLMDPDGEVAVSGWSWESSADRVAWTAIAGAGADFYTPTSGDVGRYLRVTAVYADGEGPDKSSQVVSDNPVREPHPAGHAPQFPERETGERDVPENSLPGTNVGTPISAVDDEEHPLTHTLGGVDSSVFYIDRATGQVVTVGPLDHEAKNEYSMTLAVADPSGAYASIPVVVNVTNVDEEGVVTMSTPQPHVGEEVRAYLDDPDGAIETPTWVWEVSADRVEWRTIEAGESETYTPVEADLDGYLRATVSYADGESAGKRARAVTLNPVHELETNHAPTFPPTETGVRTVPENTPPGTPIGEPFTAVDDHDHVLTYSLEGADAGSFKIATTTGQLFTKAPLDHEQKYLYSIVVTVHDGEDMHGDPDHSSDATLSAIIVVTDVDEGLAPGLCLDGGAIGDSEDNADLALDCETLLSLRDELAGDGSLDWSAGISMSEWDGVTVRGSQLRVSGLALGSHMLTGQIPSDLMLVSGLEELDLSDNALTGPIPPGLAALDELRELLLSGNNLSGCVPEVLRKVKTNDLAQLDIPHCDVLLRYMAVTPGDLHRDFEPYRTAYTAESFAPQITVGAIGGPGASLTFLDNLSRPLSDADVVAPGHQVDLGTGVTFVRARVTSADREANLTYTILVAAGELFTRYDADGNKVIDRDEVLHAVRDYFDGLIGRDEVVGMVQLYFFP